MPEKGKIGVFPGIWAEKAIFGHFGPFSGILGKVLKMGYRAPARGVDVKPPPRGVPGWGNLEEIPDFGDLGLFRPLRGLGELPGRPGTPGSGVWDPPGDRESRLRPGVLHQPLAPGPCAWRGRWSETWGPRAPPGEAGVSPHLPMGELGRVVNYL